MAEYVSYTVEELRKKKSRSNLSRAAMATEEDIRRWMIEDGQDPDGPVDDYLPGNLSKYVRERLGMTQKTFAETIRVPLATVRNWEQLRVRPDPAARALLRALLYEPEAVLRALAPHAA